MSRRLDRPATIHVVEPGTPGVGIFSLTDPDFLILNTPCGQHVMYPTDSDENAPSYAKSLYQWALDEGYQWVGDECVVEGDGVEITPDDFLPRRVMGEWLAWSYRAIVDSAPQEVCVVHHRRTAVDIEPLGRGERVHLDGGESFDVDHVVLATGHTPAEPGSDVAAAALCAYPVQRFDSIIRPGDSVAVTGLGLVALDVVTALTAGRGGRFDECAGRLTYLPSGLEPVIYLYSRSGQPYSAKPLGAGDPTGEYEPVICTPEAVRRLRPCVKGAPVRGQVDFKQDFLPLIIAEMQVRFYCQSAALVEDDPATVAEIARTLAQAWRRGDFDSALRPLAARYGAFDAEGWISAESDRVYQSDKDYENIVYKAIETDVAEASMGEDISPIKAAYEVLRILRDTMRYVIEFQGLTMASYQDFQRSIGTRLRAAVAGPPVSRSRELLALVDAGVVRLPFGPSPVVSIHPEGGIVVTSTCMTRPRSEHVDHLVLGYLAEPALANTGSPLLQALMRRGRIRPCHYGDVEVDSVDLTHESHPIGAEGRVQRTIWIFGTLTEGVRHFTHYVPSPRSRMRAFVDAEDCAAEILSCQAITSEGSGAWEAQRRTSVSSVAV